jgi:CheY-like chemotaxis protein
MDALIELWHGSKAMLTARLSLAEQAISAARSGLLEPELRQQAATAAHQLAGSLGIFGLEAASGAAAELEQLLRAEELTGNALTPAERLLATLRSAVEHGPSADGQRAAPQANTSPMEQLSEPQQPAANSTSAGTGEPTWRGRILFADDDDSVAKVVETALSRAGYQVTRVYNGAEAVGVAEQQGFDLVLLDAQMPELDGFGACRALRANPRFARVPILILSAFSDEESTLRSFNEGASDFLRKPFAIALLRARVETWMARAAAER